jgi:hypothetical protein
MSVPLFTTINVIKDLDFQNNPLNVNDFCAGDFVMNNLGLRERVSLHNNYEN